MSKQILVATEKPFTNQAIAQIRNRVDEVKGFELRILENYGGESELLAAVSNVDALIVRSDQVTDRVIRSAKNLKVIVRAGSGYDNIDIEAASIAGIAVMNTPGQNANGVAELVFGMMISLVRNKYDGKAGTELAGKKIGLHGFGNIGKRIASIAKGFGMEVFAYDPYLENGEMRSNNVESCASLEELYRLSDFVSLGIPANEETVGSINYDLLSLMPEKAVLINTARKELIDETALLQIMEERSGFLFASDIAPNCKEQLSEMYPKRTLFTAKKMGAQTNEANVNAAEAAIKQILEFFTIGVRTFQVNRDVQYTS